MDDKTPTPQPGPPALPTVLAGAKVPANLYAEGDKPDEVKIITLNIWIRQIPTRHLITKVIYFEDDEAALLEECCTHMRGEPNLPKDWVDRLTDESHLELVEKVRGLNFSRAEAAIKRIREAQRRLAPYAPPTKSLPSSSTTAPSSSTAPTTSS